ncbi:MAG: hypothetical protein WBG66_01905 [Geitlerinemataceae cyanobacterium]
MSPSHPDSRLDLPRSVRYALVVLLMLLVTPALLQGTMAFFRAFAHTLEMTFVALGLAGSGLWVWHSARQKQQQRESIQGLLDRLVSEGQPFTLFDFAAKVGLPVPIVKPYLENVSRDLKTLAEVDDRGTIYYYVKLPDSPETSPTDRITQHQLQPSATADRESPNPQTLDRPLIQAELARRLQVSASTIGKRKLKPDFTEWVRSKDPQGMSWRYSQVTKQFYPQPRSIDMGHR